MLSCEFVRLCESYGIVHGLTVYAHDQVGAVHMVIPVWGQEYRSIYEASGVYAMVKDSLYEDGHPRAIAGSMADIWTGFPFVDRQGNLGTLVVGPVFYAALSGGTLKDAAQRSGMSQRAIDLILEHRKQLPIIAFTEFGRVVSQLYYVLTGRPFDHMRFGIGIRPAMQIKAKQQAPARLGEVEDAPHTTYTFEQEMLAYIEAGDVRGLERHLSRGVIGQAGRLTGDNELRQEKNLFIVSTTLITRAAIRGGLNAEIAISLSDLLIQQVERMTAIEQVLAAEVDMPFEFTQRVAESKAPERRSKDVGDILRYIHEHVHEVISVPDVAKHVHLSPNYASSKFQRETGETIAACIRRAKVAQAKSLLTHTTLPLPEIAARLSFSSQSFFASVFRAETGLTPKQFQEQMPNVFERIAQKQDRK